MKYVAKITCICAFGCLGSFAQNELTVYSSSFIQSQSLAYKSEFLLSQEPELREVTSGYSFGLEYAYFFNRTNGIGLDVSYNINDYLFKDDGLNYFSPTFGIIKDIYIAGYKLRIIGGTVNYHFRFKKKRRSRLTVEIKSGIGRYISQHYGYRLSASVRQENNEIDKTFRYSSFELEPSLIINLGRDKLKRGIDLAVSLPNRVWLLDEAELNPKLLSGIGLGVVFVF